MKKLLTSFIITMIAFFISTNSSSAASKNEEITPKTFTQTLQEVSKTTKEENWKIQKGEVETKEDFFALLDRVYDELPKKVTVYGNYKKSTLQAWENEYHEKNLLDENPNYGMLASYTIKRVNSVFFTVEDYSNSQYSAKVIEKSLTIFSEKFAASIKDQSDQEKVVSIYNFLYNNVRYKANNYKEMLAGNLGNETLACNGFSRVFYALGDAAGIQTRMVASSDHFWNQINIKDQWITIDLATDILLNERFGAAGLSKKDHLTYVSKVGFYFAQPITKETIEPVSMLFSKVQTN